MAKGPASLCAEAGPLIWLPFKILDQKKEKGKKENNHESFTTSESKI